MKKHYLFLYIIISFVLYSCKTSDFELEVEGNWISSFDQTWKCTISKQEGKLVMQTNDGEMYYFTKESRESYSANGGTITLIYKENPINKGGCPGYEKFHWNLAGVGGKLEGITVKLLNQKKELC